MKELSTIIKIFAFVIVLAMVGGGAFFVNNWIQKEFTNSKELIEQKNDAILDENKIAGFEAGQREFISAATFIAQGEIADAREKLNVVQTLFPRSSNGPEARRILGEMNLDEILSVENMTNKKIHTVVRGDNYLKIARKYDCTIDCMIFLNGLTSTGTLHPGDELIVMPLNFSIEIEASKKRLRLMQTDEKTKKKKFIKEYLIQSMELPRLRTRVLKGKVALKRGERKGQTFSPNSSRYRESSKVLMMDKNAIQIRSVPGADEEDPGRGFFMREEDMEEIALLMRLGNEVVIIR